MARFKSQFITFLFAIAMTLVFVFSATPAFAIEIPPCSTVEGRWLTPIYEVLKPQPPKGELCGMGGVTASIWHQVMNIVNSLVLAAFIFIAFMNILRIQLDSYAVKKILPTFIMAVILANFSFLIARILLDFSNVATSYFLVGDTSGTTQFKISGVFTTITDPVATPIPDPNKDIPYWGPIISYIFKQLVAITGAVFIFILSFLFLIRNYYLYFLVAIAPAAYMSMVLPMTKKYFGQWWGQFTKWVFLPIVSVFWLWLAGRFMDVMTGTIWFLPAIFAIVCFYMAMKSPFSIGGAAVTSWGNWGKKAWGKTGGQVTGAMQTGVTRRYDRAKMTAKNYTMNTRPGKWYERHSARQSFKDQLPKDVRTKAISNAERDVYQQAYMMHITDQKKLPDAALGRVKAKNRTNIAENQITFRGAESSALEEILRKKGALSNDGRLKSEIELSQLDPDKYIDVKTILKELREQTTRAATRDSTIPIWKRLTYAPAVAGVDNRNNVRRAKFATSTDIADDVLPPPPPPQGQQQSDRDRQRFTYLSPEELDGIQRDNPQAFIYPPRRGNQRNNETEDDDDNGTPAPAVPMSNRGQYQPTTNQPVQPTSATSATPQQVIAQNDPELAGALQELTEALRSAEGESGIPKDSLAGNESIDKILTALKNAKPDSVGLAATLLPTIGVKIEDITPSGVMKLNMLLRRVATASNREAVAMGRGLEEGNADTLRGIEQTLSNPNHLPPPEVERLAKEGLTEIGE